MNIKCRPYKSAEVVPHTAGSALTGGDPQLLYDTLIGIPSRDIASGDADDVVIAGLMVGWFVTTAASAGANVWWDANGSPYGGTASSGAFTCVAADGDYWCGHLVEDLGAADGFAKFLLNAPNPDVPAFANLVHESVADNKTLDAQDVGKVMEVTVDAKAITLPATVVGYRYIVRNGLADGLTIVTISPNANDAIMGADLAGVANKDRVNTKATAKQGDYLVLLGDGADGWFVTEERGIWAAEG